MIRILLILVLLVTGCKQGAIESLLNGDFIESDPPLMILAIAESENEVFIEFNEPINTAQRVDIGKIRIVPNLEISEIITSGGNQSLLLITESQIPQVTYRIEINEITDIFNNPIQAPNNTIEFTGYGNPAIIDERPPDLISPADGDRAFNLNANLVWSARLGASHYTISVTEENGGVHIPGSPFTVQAPITSIDINLPEDRSYTWSVESDVLVGEPNYRTIHALGDTVYVYCPAGEACTETNLPGNMEYPLQSIAKGIATAQENNIYNIKVSGRGSDQAYDEIVSMVEGISLEGGFSSDFEERDIDVYETKIANTSAFVVQAVNITNSIPAILFDGFTIQGGTEGDTYALYVLGSDNTLTFSNNRFLGGDASRDSFVVYFSSTNELEGGGPIFTNNIVQGDDTTGTGYNYAIYNYASNPTITNNTISAGAVEVSNRSSIGIFSKNSSPIIENNTISGGGCGSAGLFSFGIRAEGGGDLYIHNNDIKSGHCVSSNTFGLYFIDINSVTITNNTILGEQYGGSGSPYGIYINAMADVEIIDNVISTGDSQSWNNGINISDSNLTFKNNVVTSGSVNSGGNNIRRNL